MRLAVFTLVGIILCFQHASANNFRQRNYIRTLSSQQPQQQQQQQPQQPQLRAGVVSMMMPMMGSSDSYGQQQQQQQQQQQLQTQFPVSQKNSYSSSGEQQTQQQKQVSLAVADARSDEIESKLQERNEPVINEQKVKETIENAFSSRIITKPAQQTQIEPRITVTPAPVRSSFVNPCTAEVLRMSDIMLFRDPTDKRSYLICTDIDVFHSMPCPEGTIFNDDLHHCVPEGYEAPKCPESFCKNDADCLVDETNTFKCICKVGFTGQFCETNIDECALGGAQACAGGTCVDQINGYYCIFRNGMIGLREESAIANPCTVDNFAREAYLFEVPSVNGDVWLQCVGESQFVVSKCAEHLFWNSELQTCTIERPLAKSGVCRTLPCKNGGECQDLGSSQFQCQCRPGFTGEVCENVIDLCLSNPCANGGRCLSWTGGYTCVCQNKIIDETCTSGLTNPCPPRANLIPGFNDYFAHTSPDRYFQCDKDGRAFARSCPTGLKWSQTSLSCAPASFIINQEFRATTVASVRKTMSQPTVETARQTVMQQETPRMVNKQTPKVTQIPTQTGSMNVAAQPVQNFVHLDQQLLPQVAPSQMDLVNNFDQSGRLTSQQTRFPLAQDETSNQTLSVNTGRDRIPMNFQQQQPQQQQQLFQQQQNLVQQQQLVQQQPQQLQQQQQQNLVQQQPQQQQLQKMQFDNRQFTQDMRSFDEVNRQPQQQQQQVVQKQPIPSQMRVQFLNNDQVIANDMIRSQPMQQQQQQPQQVQARTFSDRPLRLRNQRA